MLLILAILTNGLKMLILVPANNYTQSRGRKMSFSLNSWLSSSRPPLPKETDGPTAAANREVVKAVNAATRKRGSYHHYDDDTRAKIVKYSCECGNKAAVDKFTKELGFVVTESSVRNMKKTYLAKLRKEKDPGRITSLPQEARWRPLMLLEYDQDVSRLGLEFSWWKIILYLGGELPGVIDSKNS